MKSKSFISFLFLCTPMLFAQSLTLKVSNPNKSGLKNAPVVVVLDKFKSIPAKFRENLAVFVDGKQISSQLDDLNNDGISDELVFLADLKAGQTLRVSMKTISAAQRENFPTEVYADLILKDKDDKFQFVKEVSSTKNDMYNKMHHHGVAFESV